MKAEIYIFRKVEFFDGSATSTIIWKLPKVTRERPHGYKYRLNYHNQNSGEQEVKNKKTIFIGIGTFDDMKEDVIHAVKRLEAGLPAEEPRHKIYFTEPTHLSKALSPKRMELLKFLKKHGPLSRRQLAIKLKRAYANIHQDIKELIGIDLAKINREKKVFVPWDEIDIAVSLAA